MTNTKKLEFEKTFAKHCEKLGISKLCRENKKAEQLNSLMFICEDFIATLDESDTCDTCDNDNDYTKSNEEKAKEICNHGIPTCDLKCESCNIAYHVDGLIQMAEWKDEQFKTEKQALIDKACEWLKDNGRNYHSAYATEDRLIEDFKKAVEE